MPEPKPCPYCRSPREQTDREIICAGCSWRFPVVPERPRWYRWLRERAAYRVVTTGTATAEVPASHRIALCEDQP